MVDMDSLFTALFDNAEWIEQLMQINKAEIERLRAEVAALRLAIDGQYTFGGSRAVGPLDGGAVTMGEPPRSSNQQTHGEPISERGPDHSEQGAASNDC